MIVKLEKNVSYEKIKAKGVAHYLVLDVILIIQDKSYPKNSYIRVEKGTGYTPNTNVGYEVLCIYTKGREKII